MSSYVLQHLAASTNWSDNRQTERDLDIMTTAAAMVKIWSYNISSHMWTKATCCSIRKSASLILIICKQDSSVLMYKQTGVRAQRYGACLLPGLVSAASVIFMMMIFMFFSWNTFLVQVAEQEQSKAEEELITVAKQGVLNETEYVWTINLKERLQAEAEVVPSSSLVEVEVRLVLRLRLGLRLDELRCN